MARLEAPEQRRPADEWGARKCAEGPPLARKINNKCRPRCCDSLPNRSCSSLALLGRLCGIASGALLWRPTRPPSSHSVRDQFLSISAGPLTHQHSHTNSNTLGQLSGNSMPRAHVQVSWVCAHCRRRTSCSAQGARQFKLSSSQALRLATSAAPSALERHHWQAAGELEQVVAGATLVALLAACWRPEEGPLRPPARQRPEPSAGATGQEFGGARMLRGGHSTTIQSARINPFLLCSERRCYFYFHSHFVAHLSGHAQSGQSVAPFGLAPTSASSAAQYPGAPGDGDRDSLRQSWSRWPASSCSERRPLFTTQEAAPSPSSAGTHSLGRPLAARPRPLALALGTGAGGAGPRAVGACDAGRLFDPSIKSSSLAAGRQMINGRELQNGLCRARS